MTSPFWIERSLRRLPAYAAAIVFLSGFAGAHGQALPGRQVVSWNQAWRFVAEDIHKAEQPSFDDSQWKTVDVPHDWSIAGPVAPSNPTGQGGGYFPNGVGWYRKNFSIAEADAHRHVFVVFEGVMANSDVWINGFHLGKRPNGYVSFYYELTGHLSSVPTLTMFLPFAATTRYSQPPAGTRVQESTAPSVW